MARELISVISDNQIKSSLLSRSATAAGRQKGLTSTSELLIMNFAAAWLCLFVGIALFVLTAWFDDREVGQFTDPSFDYSAEAERSLWVRIIPRQAAAIALVIMLNVIFVRIAEEESAAALQTGRFFLALAESANLLRVHYYHGLVRQAARRAYALQALCGRHQRER